MRNAIIAAIVSAIVASAGAGAYTPPTRAELALRVSVLEEEVSALSSVNEGSHAAYERAFRQFGRCIVKPEPLEDACMKRLFHEGRVP